MQLGQDKAPCQIICYGIPAGTPPYEPYEKRAAIGSIFNPFILKFQHASILKLKVLELTVPKTANYAGN